MEIKGKLVTDIMNLVGISPNPKLWQSSKESGFKSTSFSASARSNFKNTKNRAYNNQTNKKRNARTKWNIDTNTKSKINNSDRKVNSKESIVEQRTLRDIKGYDSRKGSFTRIFPRPESYSYLSFFGKDRRLNAFLAIEELRKAIYANDPILSLFKGTKQNETTKDISEYSNQLNSSSKNVNFPNIPYRKYSLSVVQRKLEHIAKTATYFEPAYTQPWRWTKNIKNSHNYCNTRVNRGSLKYTERDTTHEEKNTEIPIDNRLYETDRKYLLSPPPHPPNSESHVNRIRAEVSSSRENHTSGKSVQKLRTLATLNRSGGSAAFVANESSHAATTAALSAVIASSIASSAALTTAQIWKDKKFGLGSPVPPNTLFLNELSPREALNMAYGERPSGRKGDTTEVSRSSRGDFLQRANVDTFTETQQNHGLNPFSLQNAFSEGYTLKELAAVGNANSSELLGRGGEELFGIHNERDITLDDSHSYTNDTNFTMDDSNSHMNDNDEYSSSML